ncbi:MAG: SH3 domain-containing protein [Spirochaetes bacterium]|nr:SH3 domain-containing protein [Spirochaetota bacterium]
MRKKLLVPVVLPVLLIFAGCSKTQYGIVTAREGLVLRVHPAVESARLDAMPVGTKVTVLSVDGPRQSLHKLTSNWYNVTVNNLNGWAFGGFIKLLRGELANAYLAMEEGFIELYQYKNGEFDMSVNLCQAVGMIYGKYSSGNNYIKCKVKKVDFSGFLGDDISEFEYKVLDKKSIMYKGKGIGCGPMDGMILYKFDR